MKDSLLDIFDIVRYEIFKQTPPSLQMLPNHIQLEPHKEKDGGIWVESSDLPDFYASAANEKELVNEIFEALLVYYDIPRYFSKKISAKTNRSLINSSGDSINYIPEDNKLQIQLKLT